MHEDIEQVLITAPQIEAKVLELAARITHDYADQEVLMVSVLKGSFFFTADLMRAIKRPLVLDFMAISSYGESTTSSGVVRILKDLEENIGGRHVLVVEDIVDTGLTLGYLLKTLRLRQPASLRLCTLVDKPVRRILPIQVDYRGFEIEDRFVVGYGLDYAQNYRHLPYIGVLRPDRIAAIAARAVAS
ncbi:MAG TPA: hypoxanthine phosphoribosyltransferase [Candidatus Xenobia bacterium]